MRRHSSPPTRESSHDAEDFRTPRRHRSFLRHSRAEGRETAKTPNTLRGDTGRGNAVGRLSNVGDPRAARSGCVINRTCQPR